MQIKYVKWKDLFTIDAPETVACTWAEFCTTFTQHIRTQTKERVPLFSPALLDDPLAVCRDHKGGERTEAHRCDKCVVALTMLAFDVDDGTRADVAMTGKLLRQDGIAHLWVSSHSHVYGSGSPKFRLIIPLATPVDASVWPSFWAQARSKYRVPAKGDKCAGRSHAYFLPSCPPDARPEAAVVAGKPLDPGAFRLTVDPRDPRRIAGELGDFDLPEDPVGPVDLEPLRESLKEFVRETNRKVSARLVKLVLAGEPVAGPGDRNNTMTSVTKTLTNRLTDYPAKTILALVLPSLRKMQAEGSTLTDEAVLSMIERGLRKAIPEREAFRQAQAKKEAELKAWFEKRDLWSRSSV